MGHAVLVARSLDDPDLVERLALVAAAGSFTPRIVIDRSRQLRIFDTPVDSAATRS